MNKSCREGVGKGVLESKTVTNMQRRMVKDFLDTIVLAGLRSLRHLSGYEIMESVHGKFGFLISPGTVYSLLYSLERKGLVRGEYADGKRVYLLTDEGREAIETIIGSKDNLLSFMRTLLSGW